MLIANICHRTVQAQCQMLHVRPRGSVIQGLTDCQLAQGHVANLSTQCPRTGAPLVRVSTLGRMGIGVLFRWCLFFKRENFVELVFSLVERQSFHITSCLDFPYRFSRSRSSRGFHLSTWWALRSMSWIGVHLFILSGSLVCPLGGKVVINDACITFLSLLEQTGKLPPWRETRSTSVIGVFLLLLGFSSVF